MESNQTKNFFKILSIDGGGIKGLYSSKVIEQLEKGIDGPIGEYFDLLAGTSTGGLIALGLSIRKSGNELVNFYRQHGPKIFDNELPMSRTFRFIQQLLIKSKYSSEPLSNALTEIFTDKKIRDAQNALCIPSFNVSLGKNRVFKKDHRELPGTDNELSMIDVGLATSAAPTYFPIHKISTPYFIDGGVWANNPALVGVLEALLHFVGNPPRIYNGIQILSISSLNHGNGYHLRPKWYKKNYRSRSFRDWNSDLFQTSLDAQSEFTDFFLNSLRSTFSFELQYCRIPSYAIDPKNISDIDLDKASKTSLDILETYGERQGLDYRKNKDFMDNFFSTKKTLTI